MNYWKQWNFCGNLCSICNACIMFNVYASIH